MNNLQRTEEWYAARLGKITASRFCDVMSNGRSGAPSLTAQKYLHTLLAEILTGVVAESYSNSAMDWGTQTEPEALLAYEAATFNEVISAPFINYSGPKEVLAKYVGGSPDGLVDTNGGGRS